MNLSKSIDFFNPKLVNNPIHIIGCGATGSTIAELISRLGVSEINLWDSDIVEDKNIANQMYRFKDIGTNKTNALANILNEINPDMKINLKENWKDEMLSGYIFLCVDNIEVHKKFVAINEFNPNIVAIFDQRISIDEGQHYAARWKNIDERDNLKRSQNFTHEEAMQSTPVSGCNEILSIAPQVRAIANCSVANFINLVKNNQINKMVVFNQFDYQISAF